MVNDKDFLNSIMGGESVLIGADVSRIITQDQLNMTSDMTSQFNEALKY